MLKVIKWVSNEKASYDRNVFFFLILKLFNESRAITILAKYFTTVETVDDIVMLLVGLR